MKSTRPLDATIDGMAMTARIKLVNPKPDQMIVLEFDDHLTADQAKQLHDEIAEYFPDNRVLILSFGLTMWVHDPEQALKSKTREPSFMNYKVQWHE